MKLQATDKVVGSIPTAIPMTVAKTNLEKSQKLWMAWTQRSLFYARGSLPHIEGVVQRGQLVCGDPEIEPIRNILREWHCKYPLVGAFIHEYSTRYLCFYEVSPSSERFMDNYGAKTLLSSYGYTNNIDIDGRDHLFYVTHRDEANGIVMTNVSSQATQKSIVEGTRFGLGNANCVYGTQAFETTLFKGVTGLHQGEIAAYKNEVNVILYPGDDTYFAGVQQPTDAAVRRDSDEAYVKAIGICAIMILTRSQ